MSVMSYRKCAEAKFCGNCGHSLTEEVVASSGQEEGPEQARATQAKETRPNETVEQAKRFASGYFQFLNMHYKHRQQLCKAALLKYEMEL